MPKPPPQPVEARSLSLWIFLMSAGLVLVTIWAVYDETVTRRPWKSFQKEFYARERARLLAEIKKARAELDSPPVKEKLERIEKQIAEAREKLKSQEFQNLAANLEKAKTREKELEQELIFLRSERDEAFYLWKRDLHRKREKNAQKRKARWLLLEEEIKQKQKEQENQKKLIAELEAKKEEYERPLQEAEKDRESLVSSYRALLRKQESLARKKIEIKQVLVPELGVVDRCPTCHLAIDRKGFDDFPLPFRTHPRREKLLGKVHPPRRFGCTICHQGQGPQVKGIGRKPFNHGRNDPYWEKPLLDPPYTQSRCGLCHQEEWELPLAPVLSRGKQLFADLACYACHLTPGFEDMPRIGQDLDRIRSKVSPEWLVAWLKNPAALRPGTRMPNFWPEAADKKGRPKVATHPEKTRDQETLAIAAYLFSVSSPEMPLAPEKTPPGDPQQGQKLFISKGCFSCHQLESLSLPPPAPPRRLEDYGPDLSRLGSKTTKEWIEAFLVSPASFFSEARMPNINLSPEERAHLAAFLAGQKREEPFPAAPELDSKELADKGRELIRIYGCYACHLIPGFENAAKPGPDLAGFGEKSPELLAFGDTVLDLEKQTWYRWTRLKLDSPRVFRTERINLYMPDNDLNRESIEALSVFLKGLLNEKVPEPYLRRLDEFERARQEGERLVKKFNCRGCHKIGSLGGDVGSLIRDPGLKPPELTGEGKKVQPDWLFRFLKKPKILRPWLTMQMPYFRLSDNEAMTLVYYFMAIAGEKNRFVELPPEMDPGLRADTARAFIKLKCLQCHQLGGGEGLTLSDLAPDMSLTKNRLRPQWVIDFIIDPQWLQPGTRMPSFFPLEDEEDPESMITPLPEWLGGDPMAQVKAIRDYLYILSYQKQIEEDAGINSQNPSPDP